MRSTYEPSQMNVVPTWFVLYPPLEMNVLDAVVLIGVVVPCWENGMVLSATVPGPGCLWSGSANPGYKH
jgi:hypothetical protein